MRLGFTIFTMIIFCFGSAAYGKGKSSGKSSPSLADLFLFQDTGTFKFANGIDKGDYGAFGIGLRAGYNSRFVFFGVEMTSSIPNYSGENNLSAADREANFLADDYTTNVGVTGALKLGPVSVYGTYYVDSRINGTVVNTNVFAGNANYQYHGTGYRLGVELELFAGLAVGAANFSNSYDKYSVNKDINTLTKATEADRSQLDLQGTTVTLNYRIPIGGK